MVEKEQTLIKCSIQKEPLDLIKQIEELKTGASGAVSLFQGITRDNFQGKKVLKLSYECHERMALKEMNKICKDCCSKWDLNAIAIHHRIDEVPVGEASVNIIALSAHRVAAMEATQYAIELLKTKVPIFKLEVYDETEREESKWKSNPEFVKEILDKREDYK